MSQNLSIYVQGVVINLDKRKSDMTSRIFTANLMSAMIWIFVSSPPTNSQVEILTSNMMVLGGGAFGRWLDHGVEPSWLGYQSP